MKETTANAVSVSSNWLPSSTGKRKNEEIEEFTFAVDDEADEKRPQNALKK
jgi:hypothetical protein